MPVEPSPVGLDSVGPVSSVPRATLLRPRGRHEVWLAELIVLIGAHTFSPHGSDAQTILPHGSDAHDDLITGITLDSRLVAPGDLYVALPGRAHHGAEFAEGAVRAGAVAVLTDAAGGELTQNLPRPVVVVDNPRQVMGAVAARIYGQPSARLTMLAVTGTNGKTTTSFLLDAALRAAGRHTGVIGTNGFLLDGVSLDATRTTVTTPESPELQALLAVMVEGGADACVMEVSSHALVLGRADAIVFDVAAFTNFGRDHLDFHGDEESYFEAKALLFTPERTRRALVNVDNPRGRQLAERVRTAGEVPLATMSLRASEADYAATSIESGGAGRTRVMLRTPARSVDFTLGLPGEFNVRNAITALAMLDICGVSLDRAAAALATVQVPGRMQRVDLGPDAPAVYVDFAHTPQAVAAALEAVSGRRRVVVLGCGGDRDPDKRGPIGAAAASGADVVVVTDDNPRYEDPVAIRAQVLAGARAARNAEGLATEIMDGGDRRSAIRRGLEMARPGDVLVILGKGHEVGQEISGRVLPFSDVEVVRAEWARRIPSPDAQGGRQ
ncbi:MAG: UDP-N-acetylmuramoyl-L-alanyl-D-glutamate--2,6-diaminopimelate ligase [Propionibacteriaceae bacterium]|nr:UDP-N-acetylmuramoyl-L-alanyl-D-glutamate--2,6-diaminopimelate ligase [Propionibacteriaceae bacterium]